MYIFDQTKLYLNDARAIWDKTNQILDREFAPSLQVLGVQVKEVNSRISKCHENYRQPHFSLALAYVDD